VRRITKAALGCFAGFALVLGGTQAASGALEAKYSFRDALTDLLPNPDEVGPFDSATARITIADKTDDKTTFRIHVRGIGPSTDEAPVPAAGYGAHLHVNSCDNPLPVGTGPHYKNNPELVNDRENEVWFDLVPGEDGVATDHTTVKFTPVDEGEMSVVIHVGDAATGGIKQACLSLDVSDVFPTPPPPPTE
jgi:hypothetical protein